jgi:membrane protein DedA with SNARE-associated domain
MKWRSFVLWNALGGICWAIAIGLLSYSLGRAAGDAVKTFGLLGLAAALLAIGTAVIAHRRHRRGQQRRRAGGRAAEAAATRSGDE